MKKVLSLTAGWLLLATPLMLLAQTGPGSTNHSWSNYFHYTNNYLWGTNCLAMTNAPKAWSNYNHYTFSGPANNGQQVQNRFGQTAPPADVQAVVQQFQRDRQQLMNQLRTASDEQRQQILKDMEQLRTQLKDQICQFRDQAQQQAEQMRTRLGNNRDRILEQGASQGGGTPNVGGRDR